MSCTKSDLHLIASSRITKHAKFKSKRIVEKYTQHTSQKKAVNFVIELSQGDLPSEFIHPYVKWNVVGSGTFIITFSLYSLDTSAITKFITKFLDSPKVTCVRDVELIDAFML
jgi:hypothetical protein